MISRSISDNHELARLDARDCMQQLQRMIRPVEHAHDDGSIKRHGNGNQRSLGKTFKRFRGAFRKAGGIARKAPRMTCNHARSVMSGRPSALDRRTE